MTYSPEIPDCEILSFLGEGGAATVYSAFQEKLERKVAIKVLKPVLLENKEISKRFDREAKTAARLSHPNIVQIFDTGIHGPYHYIVMEHLEESLKDRLQLNKGRLPPPIALDIVEKIINALGYAHSHKILHRDIKPGNIMFRQDSTPVLVDFGLARVLDSADELTKTGISMGTSEYMSPEQCKAKKDVDGRSDIYALGVVLYEMLTGEKPYKGDGHIAVALQHIEKPVPELPSPLERYQPLIDKMMAKDRTKRLSSAVEFEDLFFKILSDNLDADTEPRPIEPSPPLTIQSTAPGPAKSSPPPQKPESPGLNKAEPGAAARQLFDNYLKPLKDKLIPFAGSLKKRIKTLFNDYMKFIRKGRKSFKADPVSKKTETVVIGASPFIILLFVIVLIVSFGKSKSSGGKEITMEPVLTAEQLREQEYQQKYNLASQYIENYDFQAAGTVIAKLKKIKDTQKLKKLEEKMNRFRGKLRTEYQETFGYDDIKTMIIKHNFFENLTNNTGTFSGICENMVKNSDPIVICYTTGLMWYDGEIPGNNNHQEAEKWLENLNNTGYGGYLDWRFPTLEEAASLLRKKMNDKGFHLDAVFSGSPRTIWTNDRIGPEEYWVVDFDKGNVKVSAGSGKHHVRPVRSNRE